MKSSFLTFFFLLTWPGTDWRSRQVERSTVYKPLVSAWHVLIFIFILLECLLPGQPRTTPDLKDVLRNSRCNNFSGQSKETRWIFYVSDIIHFKNQASTVCVCICRYLRLRYLFNQKTVWSPRYCSLQRPPTADPPTSGSQEENLQ